MASRSLTRLDLYLKAIGPRLKLRPQSLSAFQLHSHHAQNNQKQKEHKNLCFFQHFRNSSNIVKSPYEPIEIPNLLIQEMVWATVDKFPERVAVKCAQSGHTYTYGELQKRSLQFANSLRKGGFNRGETIALVLPNCPTFSIVILGALEAELVVTFVNSAYTADEMFHQIRNSGSVCVVAGSTVINTVQAAIKKVEDDTKSKPVRSLIVTDIPQQPESLPPGVSRFSEMVADSVDHSRKNAHNVQVNDHALLPYSSGTTGLPKGVCLSHRNIVANTYQVCSVMGLNLESSSQEQDIVLGLLPFYNVYGLIGVLLNTLKCGGLLVTLPNYQRDLFLHTLENEKMSVMMLVPSLIMLFAAAPMITPKHLMHSRIIMSGAAPLGSSFLNKLKEKLPQNCVLGQGYGLTESSPVLLMPKGTPKNLNSVGVPVTQTLAKVIDLETGETVGPNKTGELYFKGPQVMLGYHKNPEATADMIDAQGWLKTGDIGYYDEENNFYILDRLKELIKVKGLQVAPAQLEEVLRTHPLVNDVAVIGVPDLRSGEVPVAYVVQDTDKKLTEDQVKEYLSVRVAHYKQVSKVIFIDKIPRTDTGKILRKDLKEMYKLNPK